MNNPGEGMTVSSRLTKPTAGTDMTALRWHLWVWDMWFLVWAIGGAWHPAARAKPRFRSHPGLLRTWCHVLAGASAGQYDRIRVPGGYYPG
jgi:hypothetical protein